jgi:hypothetical protein
MSIVALAPWKQIELVTLLFGVDASAAAEVVNEHGSTLEFGRWMNRTLVLYPFLDQLLLESWA